MPTQNQKKRHHYIPIAYLNQFADDGGRVYAYKKDDPTTPLHVKPREIAFERYYYSQPLPEGGQDNNKLEDFFSEDESTWPSVVSHFRTCSANRSDVIALGVFAGFMRVRIPATRDFVELSLAEQAKAEIRLLDSKDMLPPKPAGHDDILDHIAISIDPHQSLHAIPHLIKSFTRVWDSLEFDVLHNETDINFLTSDNPVIFFDPTAPEEKIVPYVVRPPFSPIEFLFPIDSSTAIQGRTARRRVLRDRATSSGRAVRRINRLIARFGYRFVFSKDRSLGPLVSRYASTSPTPTFVTRPTQTGLVVTATWGFGPRPKKMDGQARTARTRM
jgi:Protein of unknown function (DUF4238)